MEINDQEWEDVVREECRSAIRLFNESGILATNMVPDSLRNAFFSEGYLSRARKDREDIEILEKELSLYDSDVRHFNAQIEKRDKLIERVKPYVKYFDCKSEECETEVEQWLKEIEERSK